MSGLLLSIVSLIYLGTAISFALEGKYAFALTFLAYAVANVALTYEAMK